jgi:hypothetical protein
MKRLLFITILLSCISTLTYSQSKTEFGITTEGSWFMPHQSIGRDWATKAGFGTGIGAYVSRTIFGRFSGDIGLGYRYKQMQQHHPITNYGSSYGAYDGYAYSSDPEYVYENYYTPNDGWDKLPMHYIVVPVHLQLLLTKSFFVVGGVESTWLMNYQVVNEKPEYNWTIGFGSQKYRLKWSVSYVKGFKDQGFGDKTIEPEGYNIVSINRNIMLQLSLSCPIRLKK